jgi:hypothetical protein
MGGFSETVFPPGKILYKGLENLSCKILLRDTRFFYLTERAYIAKEYGTLCRFRTKKTLRLFELTHSNVQKLMKHYPLKPETKKLLRVAMGTGTTVGQQVKAARAILGNKAGTLPRASNTRKGQRLSYKELNRTVFGSLSKEFLIPEGYDGYYAPAKRSIFHHGTFHSEIMLVNAYQSIENAGGGQAAPVISQRSLKWALPRLFTEYCKGTKRLVKPYGGNMTIFCTGGMAVRLYLQQKKVNLPPKIRQTSDFDFTFAVPRQLPSAKSVASYAYAMQKIMTEHLSGFTEWLNRNYKGVNARLKVNTYARSRYDAPRLQVPATKRKVYQVVTYQIATGKNTVTDLVDTALAVYPRVSRDMLQLPMSYKLGIPVQKLKYQLKDSMALLSGSFVYRGLISKRNPLKGKVKEKGQKNAERVFELLQISKRNMTLANARRAAVPLLTAIELKNYRYAKESAKRVNKVLKKIQ